MFLHESIKSRLFRVDHNFHRHRIALVAFYPLDFRDKEFTVRFFKSLKLEIMSNWINFKLFTNGLNFWKSGMHENIGKALQRRIFLGAVPIWTKISSFILILLILDLCLKDTIRLTRSYKNLCLDVSGGLISSIDLQKVRIGHSLNQEKQGHERIRLFHTSRLAFLTMFSILNLILIVLKYQILPLEESSKLEISIDFE
jgi:hypothetical protein